MNYLCKIPSPLGELTVGSDGTSIFGLWIEGQKYFADKFEGVFLKEEVPVIKQVREWLDCYFSGIEPSFTPPLKPVGSDFRQSVWKILLEIPRGQVITYGQIASRLEQQKDASCASLLPPDGSVKGSMSAQAVGGAVAHNPISIIIPCHRVVGAKGSLTGYAGGITRKIKLLELEKAAMDGLYIPKGGTAL